MTIKQAITAADQQAPNDIDISVKLRWLSTLDGQISSELRNADCFHSVFRGYGAVTEIDRTELLVAAPYSELYPHYLIMRIALERGELDRYNNEAAQFNRLYMAFGGFCIRKQGQVGKISCQQLIPLNEQ